MEAERIQSILLTASSAVLSRAAYFGGSETGREGVSLSLPQGVSQLHVLPIILFYFVLFLAVLGLRFCAKAL